MTTNPSKRKREVQDNARDLVNQLEEWHRLEASGILAKLRRGLSEATQQDAWAVLGSRFGKRAIAHPVWQTVAGCFAFHRLEWDGDDEDAWDEKTNLGWSYRLIRLEEKEGRDKMHDPKEPHSRFRRLLACDGREEICEHVVHAIRLAKSKEIEINYRQLFVDLTFWGDWVKVAWAKSYWDASDQSQADDEENEPDLGETNSNEEHAPDSEDDNDD